MTRYKLTAIIKSESKDPAYEEITGEEILRQFETEVASDEYGVTIESVEIINVQNTSGTTKNQGN